MRYIQTVRGPIAPEEMGFTLPHEHIFWNLDIYLPKDLDKNDPTDPRNHDIRLENLSEVRQSFQQYSQNIVQQDLHIAERELRWFKEAGGGTICDCTVRGIGPDPAKVKIVSELTDVNIVMGTGYYCHNALCDAENAMSIDKKAEQILCDLQKGFSRTDVKAGFIKIGVSDIAHPADRNSLAAAALAQKQTGAAILIHQPGIEHHASKIFDVLTAHGADLTRVVMCHCDPLLPDHDYIDSIAKAGAYISFDFFGLDGVLGTTLWLPNDKDRFDAILEQVRRGNLEKMVISHDTVYKTMLRQYGGYGYTHIQKDLWPLMPPNGIAREVAEQLSIINPMKIFALEA